MPDGKPAPYPGGQIASNGRAPFSGWLGAKYQLSRKIIPLIPSHICYCEPFCGAAWVYFRKPPSPVEVLNDINAELINAYRALQRPDGLEYLLGQLKYSLHSRHIFEEYLDMAEEEVAALTENERAWRFLYLLKGSFAGRGIPGWLIGDHWKREESAGALAHPPAPRGADNQADNAPAPGLLGNRENRPSLSANIVKPGPWGVNKLGVPDAGGEPDADSDAAAPRGAITRRAHAPRGAHGARDTTPVVASAKRGGSRPIRSMITAHHAPVILPAAHERLKNTQVERLPYARCIKKYDSPDSFFYLDPPYIDREDYYGRGIFSREDFYALADLLKSVSGKFLLSLNADPLALELFGNRVIYETGVTYKLKARAAIRAREYLIMNFGPDETLAEKLELARVL